MAPEENDIRKQIIESQRKVLSALSECEAAIARLYARYAERFPEEKAFWEQVSRDEEVHAKSIRRLLPCLDRGALFHNLGQFSLDRIQPFARKIEEAARRAEAPDFSLSEAVKTAIEIESSILDSRFYDVVHSDAEEFRLVAETLSRETRRHVQAIQEKLLTIQ